MTSYETPHPVVVGDGQRSGCRGELRRRRRTIGRGLERRRRGNRDDELGIATAESHVDGAGGELCGDLRRGVGERLEQHQPHGGVEGRGQSLRETECLLAAGLGCDGQLALEFVDVSGEFHDTSVTPLWCHVNTICVRLVSLAASSGVSGWCRVPSPSSSRRLGGRPAGAT